MSDDEYCGDSGVAATAAAAAAAAATAATGRPSYPELTREQLRNGIAKRATIVTQTHWDPTPCKNHCGVA